jgi:hypothetical protein
VTLIPVAALESAAGIRSDVAPRAQKVPEVGQNGSMPVNADCRHYVMQTTPRGEKLERCRMEANEDIPFACPEGCLFYEPRKVSSAGWQIPDRRRQDPPPR